MITSMSLASLSELKVSRVLHAGFVFESAESKVIFDPILTNPFSHNCYAFPDVRFDETKITALDFDAIFISHYHDDHCCFDSLNKLSRQIPIYMFCVHQEIFSLLRQLGFEKVYPLQLNVAVIINDFVITPRQALDMDVDCLLQITVGCINVLNVVDSWIDDETLHLLANAASWDLILWPFQTMRELEVLSPARAKLDASKLPEEWFSQLKILNPKVLVPSSCQFKQESWSWYNKAFFPISYQQFEMEIGAQLPLIKVVRLNPSCSLKVTPYDVTAAMPLAWIIRVGDQGADYTYETQLTVPSTADMAMLLDALTLYQKQEVIRYCKGQMMQTFRELEPLQVSFFNRPRIWELNVYDEAGTSLQFHYKINKTEIALLPTSRATVSWRTDVPMVKIYSALNFGESLTSMYMRINDTLFASEIEEELTTVELTEDPLVRCLFEGKFGTYQQGQLNRIKNKLHTPVTKY